MPSSIIYILNSIYLLLNGIRSLDIERYDQLYLLAIRHAEYPPIYNTKTFLGLQHPSRSIIT